MRVFDVIERKKNRAELTREELRFFCRAVASEEATDSQIAAFCMAVLLNGMTDRECANLTLAMTESGETLPRPQGGGVFADKHSTGGVSDSTTLVLVPVLSALGVKCAKLSGRGLAHTGGTLDKMESFGCRVDLSPEEFEEQVQTIGAAVAGQTKSTVPADKRMYAVRDVTATVDSIPLIASSVMSKKLASFADIILLDVKYGSGAFMKREKDAETLARLMVSIGKTANRRVSAAITRMDSPLGDNVGCNLEARECVEVLKGKRNDLAELSLFHCAKILRAARGVSEEEGLRLAKECIASGTALEQLEKIVRAQGGDGRSVRAETRLPLAKKRARDTRGQRGLALRRRSDSGHRLCGVGRRQAQRGGRNRSHGRLFPEKARGGSREKGRSARVGIFKSKENGARQARVRHNGGAARAKAARIFVHRIRR